MEFHHNNNNSSPQCSSNSNSISSSSSVTTNNNNNNHNNPNRNSNDPMHFWSESVSKARFQIHSFTSILPDHNHTLSPLIDSERRTLSLLSSRTAYSSLFGSHSDPLCHWIYDTFLSSDHHPHLVVLSFIPLLSGHYLSRVHSFDPPFLVGFEVVLLALYDAETKSRAGKPLLVTILDLSITSIYHSPLRKALSPNPTPSVGVNSN